MGAIGADFNASFQSSLIRNTTPSSRHSVRQRARLGGALGVGHVLAAQLQRAHAAFGGGAHGLQQAFGVIPFGRHAVQAGGKTQGFHCGWIR